MLVATQGHEFSQIILKIDREPSPCRTFESVLGFREFVFFLSESCYNGYNGRSTQSPSAKGAIFPGRPWKERNLEAGQDSLSQ